MCVLESKKKGKWYERSIIRAGDSGKYRKYWKNMCGIKPLGFSLDEKALKRAGLDYWQHLDVRVYENFNDFLEKNPDASKKLYLATTKGHHVYSDAQYDEDAYLMFGKESAGIPEEILLDYEDQCFRIPMNPQIRSLNLSNSVAIVLYEALRHNHFASMQLNGELHRLHWNHPNE